MVPARMTAERTEFATTSDDAEVESISAGGDGTGAGPGGRVSAGG